MFYIIKAVYKGHKSTLDHLPLWYEEKQVPRHHANFISLILVPSLLLSTFKSPLRAPNFVFPLSLHISYVLVEIKLFLLHQEVKRLAPISSERHLLVTIDL